MGERRSAAREAPAQLAAFVRAHAWHLPALVLLPTVWTLVHEGAHALATIVQGGRVVEFRWLPWGPYWGRVRPSFPPGADPCEACITLAPYALGALLVTAVVLVARRERAPPLAVASCLFLYGFGAPVADAANVVRGWLSGGSTDLGLVFGPPGVTGAAVAAVLALGAAALGWWLQRRLYRERALDVPAALLLAAAFALLVFAYLRVWRRVLLGLLA